MWLTSVVIQNEATYDNAPCCGWRIFHRGLLFHRFEDNNSLWAIYLGQWLSLMAKICRKTWENCSRLQQLEGEVPNGRPWLCATDNGQDWCQWLRWLMEWHYKPERSADGKGESFCEFVYISRFIKFEISILEYLARIISNIGRTFNYVCFEWQSHFLSPTSIAKDPFFLCFFHIQCSLVCIFHYLQCYDQEKQYKSHIVGI